MGRKGPFFAMFSRIGFVCMPVKICFSKFYKKKFQANLE
jgi:hypothetical protein